MFMDKYEITIMKKIQELNITKQCIYLSKPFNSFTFAIILFILFVFKILNFKEIVIILLAILIVFLLKNIFRRVRPYNNSIFISNKTNKQNGNHSIFKNDKYSFPSGHTLIAVVLCFILIKKYKNFKYINILYFVPVLVGFSRVFLGVHYPSDVIFALIIGSIYFSLINKYI
jgi:undecaprenyl-diphosphatase